MRLTLAERGRKEKDAVVVGCNRPQVRLAMGKPEDGKEKEKERKRS